MSFTTNTKKELTQIQSDVCCKRAELSALVRINGTILLGSNMLDITTENPSTARHIFSLIKELYAIQPEVLVRRKIRLKKNNMYILRIPTSSHTLMILTDLMIVQSDALDQVTGIDPSLIESTCCQRAYLRGAFLAGGSVNDPDSGSYHMEIITTYQDHAEALLHLFDQFRLHAKVIERKKGYMVYMKEGDKIGEFLNVIGAHPSLLHFENVRIMKDMRNSVNRLVNCETANLNKTVQAAMRQIENIQLIDQELGLDSLPDRLREIAETRSRYPEVSLAELGQLLPSGEISKSAVNHRLRKIDALANDLRKKGKSDVMGETEDG